MKYSLKIFVIALCLVSLSLAFANPTSRADNTYDRPTKKTVANHLTQYHPALRQMDVLFVEDPGNPGFGPATKPDPMYVQLLDDYCGAGNYGWFGATTDPLENGPDAATMSGYKLVIWNCYDYWWADPALTSTDQTEIGNYLIGGGKMWLIGHDILWSGVPMGWMGTYFHLQSASQDYVSDALSILIQGQAEAAPWAFTSNCDYQANGFWPDDLVPDGQAHIVIHDGTYNQDPGIFYYPGAGDWLTMFWAVDGRNPDQYSEWYGMFSAILDIFLAEGTYEIPNQEIERGLYLDITPDPFVNSTTISYNLPIGGNIELQVYDKLGRHVKTLVDDYKQAGSYSVTWNGKDDKSANVSNGVYFLKLTCGEYSCTENLVVLK